jgi:hypothetical protein
MESSFNGAALLIMWLSYIRQLPGQIPLSLYIMCIGSTQTSESMLCDLSGSTPAAGSRSSWIAQHGLRRLCAPTANNVKKRWNLAWTLSDS